MELKYFIETIEADVEDWVSRGWIKDVSELDEFIIKCTNEQADSLVWALDDAVREKLMKKYFPKAA